MSISEVEGMNEKPLVEEQPGPRFRFVPKMLIQLKGRVLEWLKQGPHEVESVEPVPMNVRDDLIHGPLHDQYVNIVVDGKKRKISGYFCVPAA